MKTAIRISGFLGAALLAVAAAATTNNFGRTPGAFSVTSMGAATYAFPIWTPPGIAGVQPKLGLQYNSGLSDGIMGPGWTLTGLSSIARCNGTFAQDTVPYGVDLTTADHYCLDGNRLRTTGTGTYQTEIANFSEITASGTTGNGPTYFTAWGKDGLSYEYGNTTNSRLLAPGSTTAYAWNVDKISDKYGNYMTFTYVQTSGSSVISSIQYTATASSSSFPDSISFAYSARAPLAVYMGGTSVEQSQQLTGIHVSVGGATQRVYNLEYTTSPTTSRPLLTSIQECYGTGATTCRSATSVGYQYGTAGVTAPATSTGGATLSTSIYTVDFNGDGRADLAYAVQSGSTYQWWVQLASGTGYAAPFNTGIVTADTQHTLFDDFDGHGRVSILAVPSGSSVWWEYKVNSTNNGFIGTATATTVMTAGLYATADTDGDGLPDLVNFQADGQCKTYVARNTSGGGALTFATAVYTDFAINCYGTNGLGVAQVFGNNQLTNSSIKHYDFDGDGRQDLIVSYEDHEQQVSNRYVIALLSRGSGFVIGSVATLVSTAIVPIQAANWNDDECTDMVVNAEVIVSQCNGNYGGLVQLPSVPALALDWDGDGRTDLLANSAGIWQMYRSTGTAAATAVSTGLSVGSGQWIVTDQNGDGEDDLVFANANSSGAFYLGIHSGANQQPDLAVSFTDGFGVTYKPSYESLADSSYSRGALWSPPMLDYVGPTQVVTSYQASDGVGGLYTETYSYSGGTTNLQGRGFSGFESITITDSRNSTRRVLSYSTQFPTIGILVGDELKQSDSKVMSNFTAHPTYETIDNTANNQRYFPYTDTTSLSLYEQGATAGETKDGVLISTRATQSSAPDAYGNFTSIVTTLTDNDTDTPVSPYAGDTWTISQTAAFSPNTTYWCLNLPTSISVTYSSSAPNATSVSQSVQFNNPDYIHCRQQEEVDQPETAYQVTKDFTFDAFGNLAQLDVTGTAMTKRTTKVNWGTTGQFPTIVTNPLAQQTVFSFDPLTGQLLSVEDPNGVLTTWQYDYFARRTLETRSDQTTTTWQYNNCTVAGCVNSNNYTTVVQTNLNSNASVLNTSNAYLDSFDRILVRSSQLVSGAYDRKEVQYDNFGNTKQRSVPCLFSGCSVYWISNSYDLFNRLIQSQRPFSATNSTPQTTSIAYNGRTIAETDPPTTADPQGRITTKTSLVNGRLARTQDQTGYYINLGYDAYGSLLSVSDSLSNKLNSMTYDYGPQPLQRTSSDADLGPRSYTYDALGELTNYSDAKGQAFSVSYDALSRPSVRTEPDLTTTWTWGSSAASYNIGRLQSVTAASTAGTYSDSFTYDSKTRLSTETIVIPSDASYTYTRLYNATTGLLDTLQYPVSTSAYQLKIQFAYQYGLLQQVSDVVTGVHYWTENTTNPRGQFTQETFGNGVVVNHSFDAVTGWVGSIQAGVGGGAALQNNSYLFDAVGNLTQRQDNNLPVVTENVYPDSLYRLDHTVGDSSTVMTYDAAGRIATWGNGGSASNTDDYSTKQSGCTYYTNSQLHAVRSNTNVGSSYSPALFCYDANGNMTTATYGTAAVVSTTWTIYNKLNDVNAGSSFSQFFYDANHQRYKQLASYSGAAENTIYVGGLLEKMSNSSGTAYRHYIPAGNNTVVYTRLSSGTNSTYYLTKDHLGSTAVITDQTGTLLVKEEFAALGWNENTTSQEATMATVSRHEYTGHEGLDNDGIGMVNMNGRIYVPSGAFFLSPDPHVPDPGNTQSYNRYSYVLNSPLSRVDPSGFADTLPSLPPPPPMLNCPGDACITVIAGAEFDWGDELFPLADNVSPLGAGAAGGAPAGSDTPLTRGGYFPNHPPVASGGLPGQTGQSPKSTPAAETATAVSAATATTLTDLELAAARAAAAVGEAAGELGAVLADIVVIGRKITPVGIVLEGLFGGQSQYSYEGGGCSDHTHPGCSGYRSQPVGPPATGGHPMAGASQSTPADPNQDPKKIGLPNDPSKLGHIFRDEDGHLPNTPENQQLLENLANDPNSQLGADNYGNEWAAQTQPDGTQVWVQYRGNTITNGGLNQTPRVYNPSTGLSAP
jgi:RHS repeat-associated protein